ncbi:MULTISPECIES: xanthine dehydrogenase small subunit [unclassified Ensifer]|uniref:xanthine dehydrogenase small subunit n=1 Tax=unclassified Ensifer TaxID=2633371 RepID=UPI0008130291|nr:MULTISPECIES: xanthine dehydrogenase small subunit [unclassified Ensifer]OCP09676.1 xanthine dehydrogenase small subunit [Ensifer sp. LC13]OCP10778.1 xanthine dehydrogenase small subunit [Ensifer sp. LC11]OCP14109.1 xanthine dehydrogenase small subunit [Ensifer sp. LC14]OCP32854.1 xanthine dehydrogenase small subunit [Ensifer sp. LC499]
MPQPNGSISFILNDREVALSDIAPTTTLLDYLRLERRLTGTKEGCAEGDCGACTVLVGRIAGDRLVYESVNACIRFLGSLQATHVVTVEHLAGQDGTLHPVQQAMVDFHGSQCGFCTPGFVMSLYGLWLANDDPDRADIEKALQGNLCRCTGYEPIVRAAEAAAQARPSDIFDPIAKERETITARLKALAPTETITIRQGDNCLIVPADGDGLAAVLADNPGATVVAGSTDVGLWVTKQMRPINPAIFINGIAELQRIEETEAGLTIGAGVSYTMAYAALGKAFPGFGPLINRIGGEQVRNMGTIGGNIANGSPIGDSPPPLIALGATVTLRSTKGRRTLPLEAFFVAYGKQDRQPGEFVESVFVPHLPEGDLFAAYKISKRRDEDISALLGAFRLSVEAGVVRAARIAFGGMAATPKRATNVEAALTGKPWNEETVRAAQPAFETDYQPLTDWRATSDYRMLAAKNLLMRFLLESGGESAQLVRFAAGEK